MSNIKYCIEPVDIYSGTSDLGCASIQHTINIQKDHSLSNIIYIHCKLKYTAHKNIPSYPSLLKLGEYDGPIESPLRSSIKSGLLFINNVTIHTTTDYFIGIKHYYKDNIKDLHCYFNDNQTPISDISIVKNTENDFEVIYDFYEPISLLTQEQTNFGYISGIEHMTLHLEIDLLNTWFNTGLKYDNFNVSFEGSVEILYKDSIHEIQQRNYPLVHNPRYLTPIGAVGNEIIEVNSDSIIFKHLPDKIFIFASKIGNNTNRNGSFLSILDAKIRIGNIESYFNQTQLFEISKKNGNDQTIEEFKNNSVVCINFKSPIRILHEENIASYVLKIMLRVYNSEPDNTDNSYKIVIAPSTTHPMIRNDDRMFIQISRHLAVRINAANTIRAWWKLKSMLKYCPWHSSFIPYINKSHKKYMKICNH